MDTDLLSSEHTTLKVSPMAASSASIYSRNDTSTTSEKRASDATQTGFPQDFTPKVIFGGHMSSYPRAKSHGESSIAPSVELKA